MAGGGFGYASGLIPTAGSPKGESCPPACNYQLIERA